MPRHRRLLVLIGCTVALLAVALPALGADPSAKPEPPGHAKEKHADREKRADRERHADKGPKVEATLVGVIEHSIDGKGCPTFTLTVDGTTWELLAGPKWFWGADHPLAAHVGARVEVTGTFREGSPNRKLRVRTVNGQAIRGEGKPPWAGGPKSIGERHPGWKSWHADGKPGKGLGKDDAPGQAKDKRRGDKAPKLSEPGS